MLVPAPHFPYFGSCSGSSRTMLFLKLLKENELKSGGGNNTCLTQEPEPTVHSSLRRRLRLHFNIICLQTGVQVYMQYVGLMWGHYGSSTCLAELSSSLSQLFLLGYHPPPPRALHWLVACRMASLLTAPYSVVVQIRIHIRSVFSSFLDTHSEYGSGSTHLNIG